MPDPKYHESVDILLFGRAFPEVHKWIDGAFDGTNGRTHWQFRHHLAAINEKYPPLSQLEILESVGKGHYVSFNLVAKIHVIIDWLWYYRTFYLPVDQEAVKMKLREFGVVV